MLSRLARCHLPEQSLADGSALGVLSVYTGRGVLAPAEGQGSVLHYTPSCSLITLEVRLVRRLAC